MPVPSQFQDLHVLYESCIQDLVMRSDVNHTILFSTGVCCRTRGPILLLDENM